MVTKTGEVNLRSHETAISRGLAHEIDGDGWISLLHTFVPPEVRGRGLANELAHVVLEYAKQHGLRVDIVPVCFITRQNIWNISHSSAFVIPNNDLR